MNRILTETINSNETFESYDNTNENIWIGIYGEWIEDHNIIISDILGIDNEEEVKGIKKELYTIASKEATLSLEILYLRQRKMYLNHQVFRKLD